MGCKLLFLADRKSFAQKCSVGIIFKKLILPNRAAS
jgi:hypothetical protein